MPRVMEIITPLGNDVLLFHSLSGSEALGRLFEYDIGVLSTKSDIDPNGILGRNVTVKLELHDGDPRCFDGYVTRFGLTGGLGRYYHYQITARPWLWLLTRTTDCRIFQGKTVPEIAWEIFGKYPAALFENKLTGTYRTWEYCVQYRETDFNFVSRLMELEGIYYYFTHADGKHTLVLADACSAHMPFPGYDNIAFRALNPGTWPTDECTSQWYFTREIQPGALVLDDFDFQKPSAELQAKTTKTREHAEAAHERYDYPGGYFTADEGAHYVLARLEELQVQHSLAQGQTNARGIGVGCLFTLTGQPRQDQNREYMVVAASHELAYNEYEAMEGTGAHYHCDFSAIDSDVPFRTSRTTPKPVVQGPQTAIVVGPVGEEIYTDRFGRVKVRFHWDRLGKGDENSSCWIRVSHPWAGKSWGMVAIPRIGQEVLVDFLEGDPDRPIISGRVYNAEQMPPYELPANRTQTGVKTRSSSGGSPANCNEIRFEDKKGAELLLIHAEKDQDISVENDEAHSVGHDRAKTVSNDETTQVKHDRTETVGSNENISIGVNRTESVGANETITVGANRTISVGASETAIVALQRTHAVGINETIAVGAAQEIAIGAFQALVVGAYQTVNVGAYQSTSVGANQSTDVGAARSVTVGANQIVNVSGNASMSTGADETRAVAGARLSHIGKDDALKVGKNFVIDAGDSVTIKTGSASITMKNDGTIIIRGKDITIEGSGKVNVKASNDILMKGSKILQN